jgi:kynurenine formamidase
MFRVVDLSLPLRQTAGDDLTVSTLPVHLERGALKRQGADPQRWFGLVPYHFRGAIDRLGMDITLGDNLPHTHAETLLMNAVTVRGELAADEGWARRDIASVPVAEFVNWASFVDISEDEVSAGIGRELLAARGEHIRPGDYLVLRAAPGAERRPFMLLEAAHWLVEDRGIVGISMDFPPDIPATGSVVHTYFYRKAILMIDQLAGMERIFQKRFFFVGGVVLKTEKIGSSPARPLALLPGTGSLAGWSSIDLFRDLKAGEVDVPAPPPPAFEHSLPLELREEAAKRYLVRGLQIIQDHPKYVHGTMRSYRDFGSPVRIISSHAGTHIVVPYCPLAGSSIPANRFTTAGELASERTRGRAVLARLTEVGPGQLITRGHLEKAGLRPRPADIVVVATGYADLYAHRSDYLRHSPGFSADAVRWLAELKIKILVTDIPDLEESRDPAAPLLNRGHLFERGIPVVHSAANLWMIRKREFQLFCSALPLPGLDASPVRVVAVEEYTHG